jgi:hypothetical protein
MKASSEVIAYILLANTVIITVLIVFNCSGNGAKNSQILVNSQNSLPKVFDNMLSEPWETSAKWQEYLDSYKEFP